MWRPNRTVAIFVLDQARRGFGPFRARAALLRPRHIERDTFGSVDRAIFGEKNLSMIPGEVWPRMSRTICARLLVILTRFLLATDAALRATVHARRCLRLVLGACVDLWPAK